MSAPQFPKDNSARNKKILAVVAAVAIVGGYMAYNQHKKAALSKRRKAAAEAKAAQEKALVQAQEAAKNLPLPPTPQAPPPVQPAAQQKSDIITLAVESNLTQMRNMMEEGNLDPNFSLKAADIPNFDLLRTEAKNGLERYFKPASENWNPLFIAAASKNKSMVQYLLGRKASVNAPGPDGMDPLGAAIQNEDIDMVKLLISSGSKIIPEADYMTDVFSGKNTNLINLIIAGAQQQGVDLSPALPDLMLLIKTNNEPTIKTLTTSQTQSMFKLNTPLRNKMLPLQYAAAQNQTAIFKDLVLAGADVNAKDASGRSTLFYVAGKKDSVNMAKLLLGGGADIDAPSLQGYTPLMMAISKKDGPLTKLLLDSGADFDAAAYNGVRPLYLAAKSGDGGVVKDLLDYGADPEFQAEDGWTPLMFAAARGNYGTVRALMRDGASNKYKNKQGYKASDLAAQKGYVNISDAISNPHQISIQYGAGTAAKKK